MTTIGLIAGLWLAFLALAFGSLYLANRIKDRTVYRCHISGKDVTPRGVGTPVDVSGMRYVWWTCNECDRQEKRRYEAGYDPSHPGIHLTCLDDATPPALWPKRRSA